MRIPSVTFDSDICPKSAPEVVAIVYMESVDINPYQGVPIVPKKVEHSLPEEASKASSPSAAKFEFNETELDMGLVNIG